MRNDKIIHVHNDFREAPLCNLKEVEMNLMWSLLYEVKDKGMDELSKHGRADIRIPMENIIDASQYNKTRKHIEKDFEAISEAITSYKIPITDGMYRGKVVPFPVVKVSKDYSHVVVTVLVEFAYVINYILATANFTKLSLEEVNGLKGKFAKIAYYHLSTYSDTGVWHVDIDEFVRIFGIPDTYKPKDIRRRIIKQIMSECGKHFENMKYYELEGKYHSIKSVMFVFEPKNIKDYLRSEVNRSGQLEQLESGKWIEKTGMVAERAG